MFVLKLYGLQKFFQSSKLENKNYNFLKGYRTISGELPTEINNKNITDEIWRKGMILFFLRMQEIWARKLKTFWILKDTKIAWKHNF